MAARNLVILCIDTLRYNHLGAYGYERETTPRIDSLAAQGTLFETAIAQSNWTVPATASLLTSLYPTEHGAELTGEVRHLGEMAPGQLRREVQTLGDILHGADLATGLFSGNPFLFGRFKRGFDVAEVRRQGATELTDAALAWLAGLGPGEPFFLYMQYMDLHQPIEPPEPFFSHFAAAVEGTRGSEHKDWRHGRQKDLTAPAFLRFKAHKTALYDGALRYVDSEIGRLVDTLAARGDQADTLVVVTSDHGEELWDHAEIGRRLGGDPRDIWGIGHGHTMFEELVRAPLIFVGPGVVAGQREQCPVRHLEVAPTVLSALGVPIPQAMRGQDLSPWLRGEPGLECETRPLVSESPAYGPDSRAITYRGRKLIRRGDGVTLLYDLRRDAGEHRDLAAQRREDVAALGQLLEQELATVPGRATEPVEFDEETREQLRSLGYLQ